MMWLSILLIIFICLFFLRGSMPQFSHYRAMRMIIIGYFGVLLLSGIAYYLLPAKKFIPSPSISNTNANAAFDDFYESAQEGTLDKYEGAFLKEKWNFSLSDTSIDLSSLEVGDYSVFVEKNRNATDLECMLYRTKVILKDKNIMENVPSYHLTFKNNKLYIKEPEQTKLNISTFKKDFLLTQFSKEDEATFNELINNFHGNDILYLRVPSHLTITGDDAVNYVGE
ncbi:hypothetical protein [Niallia sp. 01092]|uniref:hypothetical protein n=1 Tax=unclassified Niallia TaxID=2837522 RepID=UPI003FD2B27A